MCYNENNLPFKHLREPETEGRRKKGKRMLLLSSYVDTFYKYTCRAARIYLPFEKQEKSQDALFVPFTVPIFYML